MFTSLLGGDALNADGTLKDARDMVWYNDKDDMTPIASGSNPPRMFSSSFILYFSLIPLPGTSSGRTRNSTRMAEIIEAEAQNSDTERKKKRRKKKAKSKAKGGNPNSEDDAAYTGSSSEGSSSPDEDDESDEFEISNKEVIQKLPISSTEGDFSSHGSFY